MANVAEAMQSVRSSELLLCIFEWYGLSNVTENFWFGQHQRHHLNAKYKKH